MNFKIAGYTIPQWIVGMAIAYAWVALSVYLILAAIMGISSLLG